MRNQLASTKATCAVTVTALAALSLTASPALAAEQTLRAERAHPSPASNGTLSAAARKALHQGYLVPNQHAYETQKRNAAKAAPPDALPLTALFASTPRQLAPVVNRSWSGQTSPGFAPSDSTGAVGNSNFIQLVNSKYAIYNKSNSTAISTGTLNTLANASTSDTLFDVQFIWDPTTKRFFYTMIDEVNSVTNNLAYGWSKTSSPDSGDSSDWCQYSIGFGTRFPDYPKLGDSKPFAIIGINVFVGSAFTGSEVLAIKKPGSGTSCPSSPRVASKTGLKTNNSTAAFTPVPANEIDGQGTGWVIARPAPTPSSKLAVFKVTKNDNGNAQIQGTSSNISVDSYNVPPAAPQSGSSSKIDTSDTRLTQAVGAIDPNHNDKFAVWTQHTISGGAGSKVRWYEVNPKSPSVFQKGSVSSSSLYDFNGAISPNRAVSGSDDSGGSNMLMNFNSSSSSAFPAARMVSKKGSNSQSGQVVVAKSPGPLGGFDCFDTSTNTATTCRWGDYAAATPDPKDKSKIWNVTQLASGNLPTCPGLGCVATWVTQLFTASP
jgi:hypothetical protein